MMKKIISLVLCFLMVFSYLPVSAQNPTTGNENLTQKFTRYFEKKLSQEDKLAVDEELQELEKEIQEAQAQRKKTEPEVDLKDYFDDYGHISEFNTPDEFSFKQQELFYYIRNSDWRTWKHLSQRDRKFTQDLINIAKFFLSLVDIAGLDKAMDSLEAYEMDRMDDSHDAEKQILDAANDILEASSGEVHAVDSLYTKIQHNAFYVVLLNKVDYDKVVKKYPEVKFLLDDLYTYFRWRYELRSRDQKYKLNEDNINVMFRTATYINSFLGWWELANVAKGEMVQAVRTEDDSSLRPFTLKTYSEERNNLKQTFASPAGRARYFGRVWNNIQDYAAKERKMAGISEEEAAARGVGSVPKPVRGRKAGVRREVYKALQDLSDKDVYATLLSVRKAYVDMRIASEEVWKKFVKEQLEPAIKEPSVPAWKEQTEDVQGINVEEILARYGINMQEETAAVVPEETTEQESEEAQITQEVEKSLLQMGLGK